MDEEGGSTPSLTSNLTISEDLVPSIPQKQSQTVTLDFDGFLQPPLLLQTNEKQCGGQLWPGGMVLAKFLLQYKKDILMGKIIIELGAGSGLVSLAIALNLRTTDTSNTLHITDGLDVLLPLIGTSIQKASVHLNAVPWKQAVFLRAVAPHPVFRHASLYSTPYLRMAMPTTGPCTDQNISLNKQNIGETTFVLPSLLNWGETLPNCVPKDPDVLLAADCCYIEASFPLLLSTMKELIGKRTICFFCYKKRRRADKEMIRLLMKEFAVVEIEGEWQREGMFLYEILWKG